MKICHYCRKKMKDSELFCPRCGREYREDLYTEKKSYLLQDTNHEEKKIFLQDSKRKEDKKSTEAQSMRRFPLLFILLLGLFLLIAFPLFGPLIIFFAIAALSKKKAKPKP